MDPSYWAWRREAIRGWGAGYRSSTSRRPSCHLYSLLLCLSISSSSSFLIDSTLLPLSHPENYLYSLSLSLSTISTPYTFANICARVCLRACHVIIQRMTNMENRPWRCAQAGIIAGAIIMREKVCMHMQFVLSKCHSSPSPLLQRTTAATTQSCSNGVLTTCTQARAPVYSPLSVFCYYTRSGCVNQTTLTLSLLLTDSLTYRWETTRRIIMCITLLYHTPSHYCKFWYLSKFRD